MKITFKNSACHIDGKPEFIRAGEVQYFRIERGMWKTMLNRLKEAHCNCVSTYIPWNWHHYEEGKWDFTGETHPCRDLVAFLKMVDEAGFLMILKPGPFIHNEMKNGGVPEWIAEKHPEILAVDPQGKPARYPSYPPLTYLHPVYLDHVKEWFKAVAEVTRGFADRVLLWQIDNEISYAYTFFVDGGLGNDYNPFLIEDGLYQRFLKEKFENIKKINNRYESSYSSISTVDPPRKHEGGRAGFLRVFDWIEFKEWVVIQFLKKCCDMFFDNGVKGPFAINAPFHGYFPLWPTLQRELNKRAYDLHICHCDYPGLLQEGRWGEVVSRMEYCKVSQTKFHGNNEIQSCDVSRIWECPGKSYDLLYKLLVGSGLTMLNYYWFCDGVNFLDYGVYTEDHAYNAPVSRTGQKRPHFSLIKRLNIFLEKHPEISLMKKKYDVSVGFLLDYARMSIFPSEFGRGVYSETIRLFNLLSETKISFDLVDLGNPGYTGKTKTVFVPCNRTMPKATQEALCSWAERGIHVILMGHVPVMDENLKRCNILKSALGIRSIKVHRKTKEATSRPNIVSSFGQAIPVTEDMEIYQGLAVAIGTCKGLTCVGSTPYGKGCLSVIGFFVRDRVDAWRHFITGMARTGRVDESCAHYEMRWRDNTLHTFLNFGENVERVSINGKSTRVLPRQGVIAYQSAERLDWVK